MTFCVFFVQLVLIISPLSILYMPPKQRTETDTAAFPGGAEEFARYEAEVRGWGDELWVDFDDKLNEMGLPDDARAALTDRFLQEVVKKTIDGALLAHQCRDRTYMEKRKTLLLNTIKENTIKENRPVSSPSAAVSSVPTAPEPTKDASPDEDQKVFRAAAPTGLTLEERATYDAQIAAQNKKYSGAANRLRRAAARSSVTGVSSAGTQDENAMDDEDDKIRRLTATRTQSETPTMNDNGTPLNALQSALAEKFGAQVLKGASARPGKPSTPEGFVSAPPIETPIDSSRVKSKPEGERPVPVHESKKTPPPPAIDEVSVPADIDTEVPNIGISLGEKANVDAERKEKIAAFAGLGEASLASREAEKRLKELPEKLRELEKREVAAKQRLVDEKGTLSWDAQQELRNAIDGIKKERQEFSRQKDDARRRLQEFSAMRRAGWEFVRGEDAALRAGGKRGLLADVRLGDRAAIEAYEGKAKRGDTDTIAPEERDRAFAANNRRRAFLEGLQGAGVSDKDALQMYNEVTREAANALKCLKEADAFRGDAKELLARRAMQSTLKWFGIPTSATTNELRKHLEAAVAGYRPPKEGKKPAANPPSASSQGTEGRGNYLDYIVSVIKSGEEIPVPILSANRRALEKQNDPAVREYLAAHPVVTTPSRQATPATAPVPPSSMNRGTIADAIKAGAGERSDPNGTVSESRFEMKQGAKQNRTAQPYQSQPNPSSTTPVNEKSEATQPAHRIEHTVTPEVAPAAPGVSSPAPLSPEDAADRAASARMIMGMSEAGRMAASLESTPVTPSVPAAPGEAVPSPNEERPLDRERKIAEAALAAENAAIEAAFGGKPEEDRIPIGERLWRLGYDVEQGKNRGFQKAFAWAARPFMEPVLTADGKSAADADGRPVLRPKNAMGRFLAAFGDQFKRNADNADMALAQMERARKEGGAALRSRLGSMALIGSNFMKYGRMITDVTMYTAAAPFRFFTMGAMAAGSTVEAVKNARVTGADAASRTRISVENLTTAERTEARARFGNLSADERRAMEDAYLERNPEFAGRPVPDDALLAHIANEIAVEKAADEAYRVYENARIAAGAEKGGKAPSAKDLERAYAIEIPKDLLARLGRATAEGHGRSFIQFVMQKDLKFAANQWQRKLEAIDADPRLSAEEKVRQKEAYLDFDLFGRAAHLKDFDRLLSQQGAVDGMAMGLRYAETGVKSVVYGVMVDSARRIFSQLSETFGEKAAEITASPASTGTVPIGTSSVALPAEQSAWDEAVKNYDPNSSGAEAIPGTPSASPELTNDFWYGEHAEVVVDDGVRPPSVVPLESWQEVSQFQRDEASAYQATREAEMPLDVFGPDNSAPVALSQVPPVPQEMPVGGSQGWAGDGDAEGMPPEPPTDVPLSAEAGATTERFPLYTVQPNDALERILWQNGVMSRAEANQFWQVLSPDELRSVGVTSGHPELIRPGEEIDFNKAYALYERKFGIAPRGVAANLEDIVTHPFDGTDAPPFPGKPVAEGENPNIGDATRDAVRASVRGLSGAPAIPVEENPPVARVDVVPAGPGQNRIITSTGEAAVEMGTARARQESIIRAETEEVARRFFGRDNAPAWVGLRGGNVDDLLTVRRYVPGTDVAENGIRFSANDAIALQNKIVAIERTLGIRHEQSESVEQFMSRALGIAHEEENGVALRTIMEEPPQATPSAERLAPYTQPRSNPEFERIPDNPPRGATVPQSASPEAVPGRPVGTGVVFRPEAASLIAADIRRISPFLANEEVSKNLMVDVLNGRFKLPAGATSTEGQAVYRAARALFAHTGIAPKQNETILEYVMNVSKYLPRAVAPRSVTP